MERSARKHASKTKKWIKVNDKGSKTKRGGWAGNATFQWTGDKDHHAMEIPLPQGSHLKLQGHDLWVHPKSGKPYAWGKKEEAAPEEEKKEETGGGEEKGHHSLLDKFKHSAKHVAQAIADPFKKAYKLVTQKDYRKEVKDFVVSAVKKETKETGKMFGTFKKALTGQAITKEEKGQAIHQAVDLVKVAAIAAVVHHEAADGVVKLLAAIASPADEVFAIVLDPRIRKFTKWLIGKEHGILPSAFYEGDEVGASMALKAAYETGDSAKVLMKITDAFMDQLALDPPTEAELQAAVEAVRAKKSAA